MTFTENHLYHVYNRGNNQQQLFFNREHYLHFLRNIRKFISPRCELFAWCLMPNHFHLLLYANEESSRIIKKNPIPVNSLTEGIRLTLSSYTKALQKQRQFTGNLFQQKTKCKCIDDGDKNYGIQAFHYIHQNPFKAKLIGRMEDWEFSSLQDYIGIRNGNLINKALATELLDLQAETLLKESYRDIPDSEMTHFLKPGWR